MRAFLVASLLLLLCPVAAVAQGTAPATPPAAAAASASSGKHYRGGDITRDEYIEHAKRNAEKRFDRMDANHDGVLTADERRAYREAHHQARKAPPH